MNLSTPLKAMIIIWGIFFCFSIVIVAQDNTKDIEKSAKSTCKDYEEDGWQVSPGKESCEVQLKNAYVLQSKKDYKGNSQYVIGTAIAEGMNNKLAREKAINAAKNEIANLIYTDITEVISTNLKSTEVSSGEKEEIFEFISKSEEIVRVKFSEVEYEIIFDMFRKNSSSYEVMITLGLSVDKYKTKQQTKEIYYTELVKLIGAEKADKLLLGYY